MTKTRARCYFNWRKLWANAHNRASRAKGQPIAVQTIVHVGIRHPQSTPLGIERWVHGEGNNRTNTGPDNHLTVPGYRQWHCNKSAFVLATSTGWKPLHLYGLNRNPFQIKITRSRALYALKISMCEKQLILLVLLLFGFVKVWLNIE